MAFSRGINAHEMVRSFLQHSPKMTRAGKAQCYYDPSTKAIYSYGPHYRVAWHHRCLDGSHHVLVNSQYYSQCTTAHVSGVMRALNSLMVRWIEVDLTYFDHTIQRSNRLDLITSAGASAQQAASDREERRKERVRHSRMTKRNSRRRYVSDALGLPLPEDEVSDAVIQVLAANCLQSKPRYRFTSMGWTRIDNHTLRPSDVAAVVKQTPELLKNSKNLDAVLTTIAELNS